MSKENVCYLKTSHAEIDDTTYYRVGENGTVTIKLESMTIKKTKTIASSPHDLLPSNKEEFENARSEVLIYLNNL
jgi:hypothetical protein